MTSPGTYGDVPLADLVTAASAAPLVDESAARQLVRLRGAGQSEALEALVRSHLRVAIDEAIRGRGLGEPQTALVRRGLQALTDSARSYDPVRDGRFSEHVRRAVRLAIRGGPAH